MLPEVLSITENISLSIVTSYVLSQDVAAIATGSEYVLSFDSEITSGILKVYQGSTLLFSSNLIGVEEYENIYVTDVVFIYRRSPVSVSDYVVVTESTSIAIS